MLSLHACSVLSARWSYFLKLVWVHPRHRSAKSSCLDVMSVDRKAGSSGYRYPHYSLSFNCYNLLYLVKPPHIPRPQAQAQFYTWLILIADWSVRSWFPTTKCLWPLKFPGQVCWVHKSPRLSLSSMWNAMTPGLPSITPARWLSRVAAVFIEDSALGKLAV